MYFNVPSLELAYSERLVFKRDSALSLIETTDWVSQFSCWFQWWKILKYGYESIPINTLINSISRGMDIHKSQLFWCELQGYYWFWPYPHEFPQVKYPGDPRDDNSPALIGHPAQSHPHEQLWWRMATVRAPCTSPWEPYFASFFMGKKLEMAD